MHISSKFALPSLDEVTNSNFDTIKLNFNMFKNPGFEKGNQTYHFYYTDEVNWSETSLTWNNRPESIKHDSSNLLGDFVINQGEEYEIKNDLQKAVSIDISEKIIKLIEEGTKEISISIIFRINNFIIFSYILRSMSLCNIFIIIYSCFFITSKHLIVIMIEIS